ncbi:stearoyl-CoA 9-desaturase [Leptospira santarosai str. 2000027870]|uniref:fatty acid desaturase family protein n=1 Tax=Leptospira santarosai TaxID=28183 RepID=UPI0002BFCE1D|nr:fatty acid desaturase [Leptospira santarosai]EMM87188.1 stearoyl-CoA 9-desaturase [Leptospira santarosai str. 2000027870]MDI7237672.1 fatty acid desaturase [Leptospira santarosai]
MFRTPQRNLPEKINRTIAFLLSAFFLCVYFWNPISNRVFSLFHVSSPIEIPNFVAFGSARFIEMHGSISIEFGRTSIFVCLLLISTIFSYSLWALIHECVHGNFSNSRNENHLIGRILCILFGTPYQVVKTAHLMHHKFNRAEGERIEYIEKNGGPILIQKLFYYVRLFLGTYFLEVAGGFLLSLPLSFSSRVAEKHISKSPVHKAFFKQIQKPEIVRELRIDSFLILLLYGTALYVSEKTIWFLGAVVFLRGWIVSFLDHSYHYGKELDNVHSSYNLSLPKFFSLLFLNFNYHRVHHHFPGCSWNRLPIQFENSKDTMDLPLWKQTFRQLSGLLILPEKSENS